MHTKSLLRRPTCLGHPACTEKHISLHLNVHNNNRYYVNVRHISAVKTSCHMFATAGRILTIETLPLKLARKLWAGPDHLNPDQTYFPDEYLHHVLYITRIYFIYGTTQTELIGLLLLMYFFSFCPCLFSVFSFYCYLFLFYSSRLSWIRVISVTHVKLFYRVQCSKESIS